MTVRNGQADNVDADNSDVRVGSLKPPDPCRERHQWRD
jgi:hypothetical protein